MWDPYAEFDVTTLPNGLSLSVLCLPNLAAEYVGFMVNSGANQDPAGLEGTAHFTEHAMVRSLGIPLMELVNIFEDRGGSCRPGSTGWFNMSSDFSLPATPSALRDGLSISSKYLIKAILGYEVESERSSIISEFHRKFRLQFQSEAKERERRILYPNLALGRYLTWMGKPDSVQQITIQDLQTYYNNHCTTANMCVVAVGGISVENVKEQINLSPFSLNMPGSRTPLPDPVLSFEPLSENRFVQTIPTNSGGFKSVARIPENISYESLRVFMYILDNILMDEVREKRSWAYDIRCTVEDFQSFKELSVECSGVTMSNLGQLESLVGDCILSASKNLALLDKVTNRLLAKMELRELTGENVMDTTLYNFGRHQKIRTRKEVADGFTNTTPQTIREISDCMKPEQRWTHITRS